MPAPPFMENDEKIRNPLETDPLLRLKECEERILEFESRYGMDFEGFKRALEKGTVKDKHDHGVERDFMEWEGFESERRKWLCTLKHIQGS